MKKCACLMVLCLFVSPMWLDAAVVTKVSGKEIYVDAGKKDGVQIGTMMNVYRKKEIESEYGSMKFTTQIFLGRIMAYKVGSDNTVARVQEMTSVIDEGTQKAILKSDLVQPAFVVSADGLFRKGEIDLLATGIPTMRRLVGFIKRFDALKVRIEVHTDSDTKNGVKLSRTQSKRIREWLVNDGGIKKDTLVPVGYGDQKPIAGPSSEGQKANRRVEIVIED
ncbi:MAG: OmpA family protein [Candidatus Latescibacteria bacterium]|jgi:outer membrane protein OmpA-like peptidoglycan-associated protein|nr:OmpA family protein [Candidatus Latescibacterota bacterium]MBT4137385.1 OmpA family protein [Candidatus Latescibacterota bacterium]